MKTILFLFNSSRYAVQPWLDDGRYHCVSVDHSDTDHSDTERPQWTHPRHSRLDVDLVGRDADKRVDNALAGLMLPAPSFILSFAPCTDLAVSGAAHFARKRREDPLFQHNATMLARLVLSWDCPSIVENPVSVLATTWKKPTGYVHPYEFQRLLPVDDVHPEFPEYYPPRDIYNKKTGLWCSNGAKMPHHYLIEKRPAGEVNPCHKMLGGKSARTKYIRSLTPRGMSRAIYLANSPPLQDTDDYTHDTMRFFYDEQDFTHDVMRLFYSEQREVQIDD